jgi:hypothetical protein
MPPVSPCRRSLPWWLRESFLCLSLRARQNRRIARWNCNRPSGSAPGSHGGSRCWKSDCRSTLRLWRWARLSDRYGLRLLGSCIVRALRRRASRGIYDFAGIPPIWRLRGGGVDQCLRAKRACLSRCRRTAIRYWLDSRGERPSMDHAQPPGRWLCDSPSAGDLMETGNRRAECGERKVRRTLDREFYKVRLAIFLGDSEVAAPRASLRAGLFRVPRDFVIRVFLLHLFGHRVTRFLPSAGLAFVLSVVRALSVCRGFRARL